MRALLVMLAIIGVVGCIDISAQRDTRGVEVVLAEGGSAQAFRVVSPAAAFDLAIALQTTLDANGPLLVECVYFPTDGSAVSILDFEDMDAAAGSLMGARVGDQEVAAPAPAASDGLPVVALKQHSIDSREGLLVARWGAQKGGDGRLSIQVRGAELSAPIPLRAEPVVFDGGAWPAPASTSSQAAQVQPASTLTLGSEGSIVVVHGTIYRNDGRGALTISGGVNAAVSLDHSPSSECVSCFDRVHVDLVSSHPVDLALQHVGSGSRSRILFTAYSLESTWQIANVNVSIKDP